MEPVIINSKLEQKRYRNVNLYVLLQRKILWFMLVLAFVMLLLSFIMSEGSTLAYLAIFYFVYLLAMPFLVIVKSKNYYKKIAHISEPKTYEFSETGVKITGETIKVELAWSNINKVVKRKDDYILFNSNSRSFFTFQQQVFKSDEKIVAFESLIKQYVKKNNF
ncbi:hypothetical protein KXQ82_03175 [Mucilaginibacter sp. HMF5004]|uniref:YcxB family protein n=1 Tax=Mucilaginibacter rivuli TaxID=2857527 RepID=UPI001C5E86E9|nr:YcxB family protein [Mucilaginibacter rivuli]MBW4888695.1 hypothetical protein [Mucilaginibacter rivuli]